MDEGHCGLPREELLDLTAKLIEVERPAVETALALELAAGERRRRHARWSGRRLPRRPLSRRAADRRPPRARSPPARLAWPPIDPAKAIPWVERKTGLILAESQREAVTLALSSKLLVITGGPGVGKTTLVNSILRILARQAGARRPVRAHRPGGQAALGEHRTGRKTIHRLLEINPATGQFRRDAVHPLDCDLLVIDEASMVDVPLHAPCSRAVPDAGGDAHRGRRRPGYRLGRAGPGAGRHHRLGRRARGPAARGLPPGGGEPHRPNAHLINRGLMPEPEPEGPGGEESDFHFVPAAEPEELIRKLVTLVAERIPRRFGARSPSATSRSSAR